jgi:hypothetical protein
MISELEAGLAAALAKKIAAPVDVAPGQDPGPDVRVVVGVTEAQFIEPDLGSRRPGVLPGDAAPRRAVRMQCIVSLEARAGTGDRVLQMKTLDDALYALDDGDFRSGSAFVDPNDSAKDLGFLIQELRPAGFAAPFDPKTPDSPVSVSVSISGLFWPVGQKGVTGTPIGAIHLRGGAIGIEISPFDPHFLAGSTDVELTVSFVSVFMVLTKGSVKPEPPNLPFDSVVMTLAGAGGKPPAGTLTGGTDGNPATIRVVPVTGGSAKIKYSAPAAAATDELIVAFNNGSNGLGIEIGRAKLTTRSA